MFKHEDLHIFGIVANTIDVQPNCFVTEGRGRFMLYSVNTFWYGYVYIVQNLKKLQKIVILIEVLTLKNNLHKLLPM